MNTFSPADRQSVLLEHRVDGDHREIIAQRLRHDQPVSGIAMRTRQQAGGDGVRERKGMHRNACLA
jgi:hypothetical protein